MSVDVEWLENEAYLARVKALRTGERVDYEEAASALYELADNVAPTRREQLLIEARACLSMAQGE